MNPSKTARRWRKIVNYFINTSFRLLTGERFQKSGGVPSGSCFTNIIDTIVNAIITRYCVYHTSGELPKFDMFMEDDSVVMTTTPLNLEDIAKVALDTFGMWLNTTKSYTTSNSAKIKFLSFNNCRGYPVRNQDEIIASFIFPERYHDEVPAEFTAMRCLGNL